MASHLHTFAWLARQDVSFRLQMLEGVQVVSTDFVTDNYIPINIKYNFNHHSTCYSLDRKLHNYAALHELFMSWWNLCHCGHTHGHIRATVVTSGPPWSHQGHRGHIRATVVTSGPPWSHQGHRGHIRATVVTSGPPWSHPCNWSCHCRGARVPKKWRPSVTDVSPVCQRRVTDVSPLSCHQCITAVSPVTTEVLSASPVCRHWAVTSVSPVMCHHRCVSGEKPANPVSCAERCRSCRHPADNRKLDSTGFNWIQLDSTGLNWIKLD